MVVWSYPDNSKLGSNVGPSRHPEPPRRAAVQGDVARRHGCSNTRAIGVGTLFTAHRATSPLSCHSLCVAFEFDLGMNFTVMLKLYLKSTLKLLDSFQNKQPLQFQFQRLELAVLPCRFRAGGAGTLKRGLLRPTVPSPSHAWRGKQGRDCITGFGFSPCACVARRTSSEIRISPDSRISPFHPCLTLNAKFSRVFRKTFYYAT